MGKTFPFINFQALGKENANFFGADPIVETNEKLYSKIGRFFPFAVGAKAGYSVANVYARELLHFLFESHVISDTYVDRVVVHVDLIYFLTKMIDRTFYDAIWMDAEHAEYGLFDAINRGGLLDQNGITICQWNMEVRPFLFLLRILSLDSQSRLEKEEIDS